MKVASDQTVLRLINVICITLAVISLSWLVLVLTGSYWGFQEFDNAHGSIQSANGSRSVFLHFNHPSMPALILVISLSTSFIINFPGVLGGRS